MESVKALGQDSLRRAVLAAGIEVEPLWLDETGSTNSDAVRMAEDGAPEWTVVATGHQTAGRGRLGRSWADEPGSALLVSLILRPPLEPARAPLMSLLAAVTLAEASGVSHIRSKWPNDLVVGGRKVAGILSEAVVSGSVLRHVVIGTGVNLVAPGLPGATGIAEEGGDPDAESILARYLRGLRAEYEYVELPDRVVYRYSLLCSTLGQQIRVEQPALEGLATALDEQGGLIVDTGEGLRTLSFGEVVHLRPA